MLRFDWLSGVQNGLKKSLPVKMSGGRKARRRALNRVAVPVEVLEVRQVLDGSPMMPPIMPPPASPPPTSPPPTSPPPASSSSVLPPAASPIDLVTATSGAASARSGLISATTAFLSTASLAEGTLNGDFATHQVTLDGLLNGANSSFDSTIDGINSSLTTTLGGLAGAFDGLVEGYETTLPL